jgi:uncharacterized damage-inducible protein DinB
MNEYRFPKEMQMAEQTKVANPYAKYLAVNETPMATIEGTPGRLQRMVAGVAQEQLEKKPAPEKWSVREILCHLADCEIAFGFRLRQTVAVERGLIQPFDQDAWAVNYGEFSTAEALAAYTALRRWNVLFIEAAGPEAMGRVVTHPERGDITFGTIVETMAGHDMNHSGQIEALLRK